MDVKGSGPSEMLFDVLRPQLNKERPQCNGKPKALHGVNI